MSALQNIRKGLSSSGSSIIVAILIFGLVATFGGFLDTTQNPSNSPLTVNGKNISFGEYNLELNRISSLLGQDQVSEEIIQSIAENSIKAKEILYQNGNDIGMRVSDDYVNNMIANDPSFRVNEEFDSALFRGFITRLGFTVQDYRNLVRTKIIAENLNQFLEKSNLVFENEALEFIRSTNQQRSVQFKKLSIEKESKKETVSESEIINYYQANQYKFIDPKTISVNYISVIEDDLKKDIEITEDEINEEFDLISLNRIPTQTKVSHIQISFDGEEQRTKSLKNINNVINELRQGKSFSDLANSFSDDIGSKSLGGDLGFTDGTVFPEEFENEILELDVNDISNLIELEGSFHVLKITERNQSYISKEDVKESILSTKAREKLSEIIVSVEENFLGENLDLVANELNLNINKTKSFSSSSVPEEIIKFDILSELFNESVSEGDILGPIEIDAGFILVEINSLKSEALLSQSEAEEEIKNILRNEKAVTSIATKALEVEKALTEGKTDSFTEYSLIKRDSSLLPVSVLNTLFAIELNDPVFRSNLPNGDIYVVKLTKIKNSENLAKKEEINSAKISLNNLRSRISVASFFKQQEAGF
tara:strand:- start:6023 stop:7810 length:1788 start_codon:yes stop_codon:yes gene_type:complete